MWKARVVVLVLQKTLLPSDAGCGQDQSCQDFGNSSFSDNDPDNLQNFLNHDQGLSTQKSLKRQVTNLCNNIRKTGNPLLADFSDLDSRDCGDESVTPLTTQGRGNRVTLSEKYWKNKNDLFMNPLNQASQRYSGNRVQRLSQSKEKRLKLLKIMCLFLVSCISHCRAVKGIWKNSFLMKYNPFLPHCQNSGNFICRVQSLNWWHALSHYMNLRHLKHPTVNYWMVLSSYTACPSLELQHSKKYAEKVFIHHLQSNHREQKGWTLYGTQTRNQVTRRLVRLSAWFINKKELFDF